MNKSSLTTALIVVGLLIVVSQAKPDLIGGSSRGAWPF